MKREGHQCECAACASGRDGPEREAHAAMNVLMEQLDERQRRLYAATEATKRGWGGIRQVREITGISYTSLRRGLDELQAGVPSLPEGRVRAVGGGRKPIEETQPGIKEALQGLVDGQTAGDPEGGGRWVRASLQHLKAELAKLGFNTSHQTVSRLLGDMGYRLRVNAKEKAGPSHPDRDKQFGHIQKQVAVFQGAGDPVISVDTKKRNSSATSRTPAAHGDASPTR